MVTTQTPLEATTPAATTVPIEHMPPLVETPEGHPIPEAERLTPSAAPRRRPRDHTRLLVALGLAGVVSLFLAAIVYSVLVPVTGERMGLSDEAWASYRAGERATAVDVTAAWQDYRSGERATAVDPVTAWQDYRSGERVAMTTWRDTAADSGARLAMAQHRTDAQQSR